MFHLKSVTGQYNEEGLSVDKVQVKLVMEAKDQVSSLSYSFGHFPQLGRILNRRTNKQGILTGDHHVVLTGCSPFSKCESLYCKRRSLYTC